MKKTKILVLLAVAVLAFMVNTTVAIEHPTRFRGLMWGTDFSTVKKEMVYSRTDPSYGGVQLYDRKNDEMSVGNVKVKIINYEFWQGKFCGVWIAYLGESNFLDLLGALKERFGEPHQPNRFIEEYLWLNFAEGRIGLRFVRAEGFGDLWIRSRPISEQ